MTTAQTRILDDLQFESRGLTIKARQFGNPAGTKVLGLHGWLDNADTFAVFAPFLEDIHLVAIDLPGHGLSGHRSEHTSYYLWEYVNDVIEVLEQLKWQKPHILAHSMGTGVAAILAAAFPKKAGKLCFLDGLGPAFVTEHDDSILNYYKKSVRQLKLARKTHLYGFAKDENAALFNTREEAIQNRMSGFSGTISRVASEILVKRDLLKVKDGFKWRHDPRLVLPNHFCMTEKQAQVFIKNIQSPVKIILGTEGLFANGDRHERIDQFRNADLVQVEGNHHFHLDTPLQTSLIINDFFLNN